MRVIPPSASSSIFRLWIYTLFILFCISYTQPAFAATYWWRTVVPGGTVNWQDPNNWSTTGFAGGPAGTFPGASDVATFGLLAETPYNLILTNLPAGGVGGIDANSLQRTLTIPVGETLIIVGGTTLAGGNAAIYVNGTMRVLNGAGISGAGGAVRIYISGTFELQGSASVTGNCMGFGTGSTLMYTGGTNRTVGPEFNDGATGTLYAGGFPGNIGIALLPAVNCVFPNNAIIAGNTSFTGGKINDGFGRALTFNGNFIMSSGGAATDTRLVLTAGAVVTLNGATNTATNSEIWNNANLVVNTPLTVNGGNMLLVGGAPGGTVTGSSNINYTGSALFQFQGGWTGSTTPQMFPALPAPMPVTVDINSCNVTIGSDVHWAGNIILGTPNIIVPAPRRVILGNGTLTFGAGRFDMANGSFFEVRRPTLQAAWFLGNQVGNLEIRNPTNVTLTNNLTVNNGIAITAAGNLIVGGNTLTFNSSAMPFFTGGGPGKIDATNAASVILVQNNPTIDCNYFTGTVTRLQSGTACAASLLGPITVGNLAHGVGTFVLGSSPPCTMTLVAGGAHTVATTLDVASFARLVVPNGATLTNNGTINVGGAATVEVQGNGIVNGTSDISYNALTARLLYSGGVVKANTGREFPNAMGGMVEVANTAGVAQAAGPTTKTVAGQFLFTGAGVYSINGSTGNGLILNGTLTNTAGSLFQAFDNDFTINNTVVNPLRFGPTITEQTLRNLTIGASAGNITLGTPLFVNATGVLTMNGGNIVTSVTNSLTINNSAAAAVVRTNGFVDGPLIRAMTGAGAYLFPLGNAGQYQPMTVTNPGAVTITASTFAANAGATGGTGFSSPSTTEYWFTNNIAGAWGAAATITLQRPANFAANTTIGRRDAAMSAGVYNSVGPTGFAGGTNIITSNVLTTPAAPMYFTTGVGLLPPTNLTFSAITNTSYTAAFTASMSSPVGYLVVRSPAGAARTAPTNGVLPPVGSMLGMGTVLSNSAAISGINDAGLTAGTTYSVDVYAYFGSVASPQYLVGQFLTADVTTTGGPGCTLGAPPTTVNPTIYERSITFTGVALTGGAGVLAGGGTNLIYVDNSAPLLTLSYNYTSAPAGSYCPGCITQIYVGMNSTPATNVFRDCINFFPQTVTPAQTRMPTFNAPTASGVYYINVTGTWDYSCQPVNFGTSYIPGNTIAILIVGTPPAACINNSDILPLGFVPNTAIPYVSQTGATVVAGNDNVWNLRLRDGGVSTPDGDTFPTVLQSLTVSISNPTPLANIALYNSTGTVKLDEQPAAASVTFNIPAGAVRIAHAFAPDNGTIDFWLKANYKSVVTDNAQFNFSVTNAVTEPFTGIAPRSGLLNPAAMVGPSGNSGIAVTATRLNVLQQPAPIIVTGATVVPNPSVEAVDINGNRDVDYTATLTASNPKLTPSSPNNATAVAGVATFPAIRFLGATNASETLVFDDIGPFTALNSSTFSLIHPSVTLSPALRINLGNIAMGTFRDTTFTISASNVIANGSAYFASLAPGMSFSFPMMPLQVTPLTLSPTVLPTDVAGVSYTQQIRVRYQPPAAQSDSSLIQVTFGQTTVPIRIVGRGVNPNPFTLSFTRRESIYDSTGLSSRAVQSGSSIATIVVSVFRQDSVFTPITATRTVTLTALPLPGSTGTFSLNGLPSISVPISNTTSATFSNVVVRWTNAPLTASNTQLLLRATTDEPGVFSTTISITVNVGNTVPRITSFSPRYAAPAQAVFINGTDFFNIQSVRFNGILSPSVQVLSPTQIQAIVPSGILADTGRVSISNGIFADSLSRFEIARPPQIRQYFALSNGVRRGYEENVQAENKSVRFIGQFLGPRFNTGETVSAPNVEFGGVPAGFALVNNDSTALAVVGAGASGTVRYENLAGVTTATIPFEFLPQPVISNVTPILAGLGREITITGANFRIIDTLRLGNVVLPSSRFTVDNNFSRLRFTLRDTVSNATITLVTAAGSTTSSQRLTYVPPPELLTVSPDTGSFGSQITLTGRNLTYIDSIMIGERRALAVSRVNNNQVIAIAGAGLTGQAPIVITTPGGSTSSSIQFTFINIPQVLRFSPVRGGPDTEVIITGANFSDIRQVTFGGVAAKRFTVRSTTEIIAVVDDIGASGMVTVLNSVGQGLGQTQFDFYFPPRISGIEPPSGATGSSVSISGEFFIAVSTVTIGGVPVANFNVESTRLITAIVATGATGRVVITNLGGTGTSPGTFRFVEPERPAPPFITTFTPDTAFVGDILRVEGFNFINIRNVKLGGVTVASYTVDSPTQMTLVVPRTSTGTLEITSTTGTGIAKKIFIYAPPPKPLTPQEQDSIAAVQLYNATAGQDWARQRGWLTTVPLSQWQGVTVENGRITRLSLDSAGLRGEIPAFINRLTALKSLTMRTNALSGAFPQGLTLLPNLEEVILSNNQFTGSLPTGLASMRQLRILHLDGNRFTGAIPEELCALTNAQDISLARNSFTGRITSCLANLVTLQRLDLSQNQLVGGIPTEFAALSNLRELNLSNNLLEIQLPSTIWGNTAATVALTKQDVNASNHAAAGMISLTRLDLSNNRFTGNIPVELANASRLETLLLNNNRFTGGIPAEFGTLKSLRELNLASDSLTGQIPVRLTEARSLERLILTNNRLTGSIPAALSTLPDLRVLALDSNEFAGAVPESFVNLARLQNLRVQKNLLTTVPNLRRLSSLTVLNVAQNQLVFETIEPNLRSGDVAFTYTFAPQDTVRTLRDTSAAVGFRFGISLRMTSENNVYQWFKNGRAIPNSNNVTLNFPMFTRLDTGVYHCAITNTAAQGLRLLTQPIRISAAPAVIPSIAPTLVSPANGAGNVELTTSLEWEAVAGAGTYDVQMSTDSAFTVIVANESTSNTSLRPNIMLTNFTTYRWRVRARNEAGAGVWSVVRNFTTIQEGAVLIIPDTDLGRSTVGRQRVGSVTIQNILTIPVTIDAARIEGRDAQSFGIRTSLTGVVLMPSQSLKAELIFTPQSIGAKQAELILSVSSGGSTKAQRGILRGTASFLDVNDVKFDTVLAGFDKIRNVQVLNLGAQDAVIQAKNIRIPAADTSIFKLDLDKQTYTVSRGDTLVLPLRCSTSRIGNAETTISLITDTGEILAIRATAFVREVTATDIVARFALKALDNNVAPGGRVRLKLYLDTTKSDFGNDLARGSGTLLTYSGELRFNKNVLVPASTERALVSVGKDDDLQRYSITRTTWDPSFASDKNEIAVFTCIAVSGNVDTTPLFVSDIKWGVDNSVFVVPSTTANTFTANVCKAGGLRLTTAAKRDGIAQIRPNPVKDVAEITYTVREDGNVTLSLMDAQGKQVSVLVSGVHSPGEYSLSIPTSQFASGSYFLVMATPNSRIQERMQVVK